MIFKFIAILLSVACSAIAVQPAFLWRYSVTSGLPVYDAGNLLFRLSFDDGTATDDGPSSHALTKLGTCSIVDDADGKYANFTKGAWRATGILGVDVDDFTMSMWVRRSSNNNMGLMMVGDSADLTGLYLFSGSSSLSVLYAFVAFNTSSQVVANAEWHHVAISRTGTTTAKLFYDGIEVYSPTGNPKTPTSYSSFGGSVDASGNLQTTGNNWTIGDGDEYRIYNYGMSTSDVYQVFLDGRM